MRFPVLTIVALVCSGAAQAKTIVSPIFVGTGKMQINDLMLDDDAANGARVVTAQGQVGMNTPLHRRTFARHLSTVEDRLNGYLAVLATRRQTTARFASIDPETAQPMALMSTCTSGQMAWPCPSAFVSRNDDNGVFLFDGRTLPMAYGVSTFSKLPRHVFVSQARVPSGDLLVIPQRTNRDDVSGFDDFDSADLNPFSTVPLPAGLPLLLTGLAGLGAVARRWFG